MLAALLVVVSLIAVSSLWLSGTSRWPAPMAGSGVVGVSVPGYLLYQAGPSQLARDLDRVAASGATWLRLDVSWSDFEPAQGRYDWDEVDRVVAAARSRDLKVLGILGGMPAWIRPANTEWNYGPRTEAQRAAYARFASVAAQRYRDSIHAWEIWNEPNLPQFWQPRPSVEDYGKLLKVAYPAVKAASPSAVVLAGGTGGGSAPGTVDAITWYRGLYAAGLKTSFDVLAVHPYTNPNEANSEELAKVAPIRALATSHGDSTKPIWGTESGIPTAGEWSTTEEGAARLLLDTYALWQTIPHHGPLFAYTLNDIPINDSINGIPGDDRLGHFGLFRQDGTPKPAYAALQHVSTNVKDAGRKNPRRTKRFSIVSPCCAGPCADQTTT